MLSVVLVAAACGGKSKPAVVTPTKPVEVAKPAPPPPPPVCVPATEPAMITSPNSDGTTAEFCASDSSDGGACFSVALADGKYQKLSEAPSAQAAWLSPGQANVETTATEVKVCVTIEGTTDASCTTLKPKVAKGATEPLRAHANPTGTPAVIELGNASSGKGYLEVWDVAKKKKTATIKYAKGDYKCGQTALLGDAIFVSASVCSGPDARGWLFNLKGKKVAEVGGKDFGTYGTAAVQVAPTQWAFLEEGAGAVAIQDVATGAIVKTIDLVAMWAGDDASDGARASGNPGESALVRGGDNQLIAIAGSPAAGNLGIIATDVGEVRVVKALPCAAAAKAEPAAAPEGE